MARASDGQRAFPPEVARRHDGEPHRTVTFGANARARLTREDGDRIGKRAADQSRGGSRRNLGVRRRVAKGERDGEAADRNTVGREAVAARQAEAEEGSPDTSRTCEKWDQKKETPECTSGVTDGRTMSNDRAQLQPS